MNLYISQQNKFLNAMKHNGNTNYSGDFFAHLLWNNYSKG